jgi:hypothetical protein
MHIRQGMLQVRLETPYHFMACSHDICRLHLVLYSVFQPSHITYRKEFGYQTCTCTACMAQGVHDPVGVLQVFCHGSPAQHAQYHVLSVWMYSVRGSYQNIFNHKVRDGCTHFFSFFLVEEANADAQLRIFYVCVSSMFFETGSMPTAVRPKCLAFKRMHVYVSAFCACI